MDNLFNVLVLGHMGVGVTSVVMKFLGKDINSYVPSIEDEFSKTITVNGEPVSFVVIDIGGQEDFRDLRFRYLRDAQCYIFVYSVDNEASLNYITELHDDVIQVKQRLPPCLILGNKCDLPEPHEVTREQAESFSKLHCEDVPVVEVSAKLGKNIEESFAELGRMLLGKSNKQETTEESQGHCCNIQ